MITAKEARKITDICKSVDKYKQAIFENASSGLEYCIISNPSKQDLLALKFNGYTVFRVDYLLNDYEVSW